MFGPTYFGRRYYGIAFWGVGSSAAPTRGIYWSSNYTGQTYWGVAYWPGLATVVPPLPSDLLSCLMAFLNRNSFIQTALGDGEIYSTEAPANVNPPFIVVDGYIEEQPGEDIDDNRIDVAILIRASSLDQCRTIALAVKLAIDTPTINPRAPGRDPFAWSTGTEHTVFRDNSKPERLRGVTRGSGPYGYREQIDYSFYVTPVQ